MIKQNYSGSTFLKIIFLIFLAYSSTGCLIVTLLDNVGLCQECVTTPIAYDGTHWYRAIRNGAGSSSYPVQLEQIDSSGTVTIVAGNTSQTHLDGIGTAAQFTGMKSFVIKAGTPNMMYVGDTCTIRTINMSTWQVTTIAGSSSSCTDANGTGTASARFNKINDLYLIGSDLYIITQFTIKKMDITSFVVTTVAGSTIGYNDATGASAQFNEIGGATVVGGNMYVLDGENKRIRRIVLSTGAVTTIAGNGDSEIADGTGTAAKLNVDVTNKLTTDGLDHLFFTDDSSIRSFQISTGEVKTILGPNPDDVDGLLADARAFYPKGIVYTPKGLFFGNHYGLRKLR